MNQNDQNLQRLFQDDLSSDESDFEGFDAREIDALDRRLAVLHDVDSDTQNASSVFLLNLTQMRMLKQRFRFHYHPSREGAVVG